MKRTQQVFRSIYGFARAKPGSFLSVLGIVVLFIALRWQTFNAPLIRDEGEYAYAAKLLRGGQLPYAHSFLQKPPMIAYTYLLADLLAPDVFWFPRILAALSLAGCALLMGYIARMEFGDKAALPTVWLFTPMVLMPGLNQAIANVEVFMLLPLLGLIALYCRGRQGNCGRRDFFAAGVLTCVTLLYKYTAFPVVALIWFLWWFERRQSGIDWRELLPNFVRAGIGGLIASLLILAPFLLSDGGKAFWECTVQFNRAYSQSLNFGFDSFVVRLLSFWREWPVICYLPLLLLLREPAGLRRWLVFCGAAMVATAGSCYLQYYVMLMTFWAVVCGVAISATSRLICFGHLWLERTVCVTLTGVAVVLICLVDLPLMRPGASEMARVNFSNPFPESKLLAAHVDALAAHNESLLIAGSEPQIYYYAHRKSCTRFIIAYPMMIPNPLAEQYQLEAIREVKQARPGFVVMALSNTSWLEQQGSPRLFRTFLASMLAQEYEPVAACIPGCPGGSWIEPATHDNTLDASLVLYRRKATLTASASTSK